LGSSSESLVLLDAEFMLFILISPCCIISVIFSGRVLMTGRTDFDFLITELTASIEVRNNSTACKLKL
jgi:hypothetical protein